MFSEKLSRNVGKENGETLLLTRFFFFFKLHDYLSTDKTLRVLAYLKDVKLQRIFLSRARTHKTATIT